MDSENKKHLIAAESWQEEKRSVYLYQLIATNSSDIKQKKLFQQLAKEAESQSQLWAKEAEKLGHSIRKDFKPDFRTYIVGLLIKWFGTKSLRPILSAMKVRGMSVFSHDTPGHPMPKTLGDIGTRHRSFRSSNNLRAAVFGINDGLISNASLIMGMAGGHFNTKTLILGGIAGLFAGAFSMAAGEYVSVRSQREMFEYQINLEKKELELYPQEEAAELSIIYEARGLSKEEAEKLAHSMMQNKNTALDVLAREELGLNPDDLVSPYGAALFSFLSFLIGAAIPLLPFLFNKNLTILASMIVVGVSLFLVGSIMSLYTGRSAIKNGMRMLLIGAGAASITYLVGHLVSI